jgi:peptidoglycan/xylan/chitin deacetylase (PgdA/CDA1 family)
MGGLWQKIRGAYERRAADVLFRRPLKMQNAGPLISFTFDDFPRSALHTGGAILQKYGLRGTYYASLGLTDSVAPVGTIFSREDLSTLLAHDHELGCHTYSHCHAWNTAPAVFQRSLADNERQLGAWYPQVKFRTMSYPISGPRPRTKRRMSRSFACCRGGGQSPNVGVADLNYLRAFFIEKAANDPADISRVIERNAQINGWLIFATHDVSENPTRFGCTPALFESVVRESLDSGATILPVIEALKVVSARE